MIDWNQIKEKWASLTWSGTAGFALPPVVLEAQPDFVMGARLAGRASGNGKGNGALRSGEPVRRISVRSLAPGSVRPGPAAANLADSGELVRALRGVTEVIGNGTARFGFLVPDAMVRVGLLSFETLPPDRREADTLIRWRMKENLPFPAEEARISYQVVSHEAGGIDLLAVAARASVLVEYEAALEEVNGGSASVLMLPASLALLPLLPESGDVPQALVHVCSGWVTHVVVTGQRVSLWRTREVPGTGPAALLDGVATEASRVIAASRDRQQIEIGRFWLCARPPAAPSLAADLGRVLSREVEVLEADSSLASALPNEERRLFEQYGATVAGLVSNSVCQ